VQELPSWMHDNVLTAEPNNDDQILATWQLLVKLHEADQWLCLPLCELC